MKRVLSAVVFFILASTSLQLVRADRGLIAVTPGVSVYEPGQKAIIAWNGQEEILILSTDVTATQETLVLEILPVPSNPQVEAASFQSFETIQEMIWEEGINRFTYSNEDSARHGSVEVLFHEQIGAHNITVVLASDSSALVDWAGRFLSASGISQNITLARFQTAIEGYMNRGFRHFVLDLVTFSPQEKSINPILYRFNSSTLYYPLVITSPVGGSGKITVFSLTEEKVQSNYWPLQTAHYQTSNGPWQPIQFTLSSGELSKIDLRIGGLLPDGAWLNVLTFEGDLGTLSKDIMLTEDTSSPQLSPPVTVIVTLPADILVLCFLLGAASILAGLAVALLIGRMRGKNKLLSSKTI